MAKDATQAPSQLPSKPSEAAKKRKGGEIDDIFAAAKKPKLAPPVAATEAGGAGTLQSGAAEGKKGKKRRKAAAGVSDEAVAKPLQEEKAVEEAEVPPKRVPETVVDTSKTIETYKPPPLARKQLGENATEEERRAAEEEERFMDSRGNRKRTEDGLPIYSEAELKIGFGGDTPLCPFDCECCY